MGEHNRSFRTSLRVHSLARLTNKPALCAGIGNANNQNAGSIKYQLLNSSLNIEMMKYQLLMAMAVVALLLQTNACSVDDSEPNKRNTPKGYSLVWNDEFDGSSIDENHWNFEYGDGTDYGLPKGWGNEEEQIYTDDFANASVGKDEERSVLTIRAIKTGTNAYTSAKLTTQDKLNIRFGRVDVKAKMPVGDGLWSAIWTLGANRSKEEVSWPGCGEIDLVEVLGSDPAHAFSTVHFTNAKNKHEFISNELTLSDNTFSDSYHLFSLEWTPETISYFIDDELVGTVEVRDDMKEFMRDHYLILNVAVGGTLGGVVDPNFSSSEMLVDYVRVYEKDDFTAPDAPVFVGDEEVIGKVIDQSVVGHFLQDGFETLGEVRLTGWGPKAPDYMPSDTAINGDMSTAWTFPAEGDWGGGYLGTETPINLSSFTNLAFAFRSDVDLLDAEIKLESPNGGVSLFLKDYTATDVSKGFKEYVLPLSDFIDLETNNITVPFSIWNIETEDGGKLRLLVDNVRFE